MILPLICTSSQLLIKYCNDNDKYIFLQIGVIFKIYLLTFYCKAKAKNIIILIASAYFSDIYIDLS